MKSYININGKSNDEIQAIRKDLCTSSDFGAILNISPYKDAVRVYRDKVEGSDFKGNDRTRLGLMMEGVLADYFADETGYKVVNDNKIRLHPDHQWLSTSLDRVVTTPEGRFPLEIKTANEMAQKNWDDDYPSWYKAQIQGQMAITGWHKCYVMIFSYGFNIDYQMMEFEFDEEWWNDAFPKLEKFWFENVKANVPPEPMSEESLKYIHPVASDDECIPMSSDANKYLSSLIYAKKEIADWNKIKKEAELSLKKEIGDAEVMLGENYVVTYKNSKGRSTFDKKSFGEDHPELLEKYTSNGNSYRTLRIKEANNNE